MRGRFGKILQRIFQHPNPVELFTAITTSSEMGMEFGGQADRRARLTSLFQQARQFFGGYVAVCIWIIRQTITSPIS
jgi:hypothetical protein